MESIDFGTLFQGFGTMMASGWFLASARMFLIALGFLLIYLGWKGVLEPMVMIPMGLGMVAINCGTLIMPDGALGNLFLDPMLSDTDALMNTMQIDFLQPVYTLTFSNGLIAALCLWESVRCSMSDSCCRNRLPVFSWPFVLSWGLSLQCLSLRVWGCL